MFQFVSLADRTMQVEEVAAFVAEVEDALAYKDPLHRDIFADLTRAPTFKKAFAAAVSITSDSASAIEKEFKGTRKILQKKLSSDEYHRFFVSLTGTGVKVAAATEGVSASETAALAVFLGKFAVDVEKGKRALALL